VRWRPRQLFGRPLFWVFVIVFMAAYPIFLAVTTQLPPVLPVIGPVPAFEGAEAVTGRVFAANFVSLKCGPGCRQLETCMFDLQHRGRNLGDSFKLLTFVVDGKGREAEVEAHARSLRASQRAWTFIPGAPEHVVGVVGSFLEDSSGLLEARWIVLVDQQGRIRAIYDAAQRDIVKRILIDAGLLLNRRVEE
jgi:hypothetical protein